MKHLFSIFFKKQKPKDEANIFTLPLIKNSDKLEQLLIEKIINKLESEPEFFSAKWSDGTTLDLSICSKNKKIQIMINSGNFILPNISFVTKKQREKIILAVNKIYDRDKEILLKQLLNDL